MQRRFPYRKVSVCLEILKITICIKTYTYDSSLKNFLTVLIKLYQTESTSFQRLHQDSYWLYNLELSVCCCGRSKVPACKSQTFNTFWWNICFWDIQKSTVFLTKTSPKKFTIKKKFTNAFLEGLFLHFLALKTVSGVMADSKAVATLVSKHIQHSISSMKKMCYCFIFCENINSVKETEL